MKAIFLGEVKDGKLSLGSDHNASRFRDWMRGNEGKKLRIMEQDKPTRSLSQNRYYWAYLGIISMETGDSAGALHQYFKRQHLSPKFIHALGKEIKVPASTTELTKHEMSEYLMKISAESDIPIPNPKEMGYQTGFVPITKSSIPYPSSEGEVKF